MQRSAGRPSGSASARVRPASSSTRWNDDRPVARGDPGPERGVRVHPLPGRGARAGAAGARRGRATPRRPSRSPITVTSVSGSVVHIRPFPSDSTTPTVPVSATAKFAPETATRARQERVAEMARAAASSDSGSSVSPGSSERLAEELGDLRPARGGATGRAGGTGARPRAGRSARRGRSRSARSRLSSRASLSPSSSVVSDLTLTTSRAPVRSTRSTTTAFASVASRAQWTTPPAAVTAASSPTSSSSRRSSARSRIAAPAARSSAQSGVSPTTAARRARIVVVARCDVRPRLVVLRAQALPHARTASRGASRRAAAALTTRAPRRDGRRGRVSRAARARRRCAGGTRRRTRTRPRRRCARRSGACRRAWRSTRRRSAPRTSRRTRSTRSRPASGRSSTPAHGAEERLGPVAEPERSERVAGRVIRRASRRSPSRRRATPSRSTRNSESSRSARRRPRGRHRRRRRARGRGRRTSRTAYDRVVTLRRSRRTVARVLARDVRVAGVEVELAAARLAPREDDLDARAARERRPSRARRTDCSVSAEAGDEERHAHARERISIDASLIDACDWPRHGDHGPG